MKKTVLRKMVYSFLLTSRLTHVCLHLVRRNWVGRCGAITQTTFSSTWCVEGSFRFCFYWQNPISLIKRGMTALETIGKINYYHGRRTNQAESPNLVWDAVRANGPCRSWRDFLVDPEGALSKGNGNHSGRLLVRSTVRFSRRSNGAQVKAAHSRGSPIVWVWPRDGEANATLAPISWYELSPAQTSRALTVWT